jgi:transposase
VTCWYAYDDAIRARAHLPASDIAAELGCPIGTVCNAARRLGVTLPPATRRRQAAPVVKPIPTWHDIAIPLLGTMPDAEIGARVGRTANTVSLLRRSLGIKPCRRIRKSAAIADLYAQGLDDATIAATLGCSRQLVQQWRARNNRHPHPRRTSGWRTIACPLLGAMSDAAIAARVGVSVTTISAYRRRLGIAAYAAPPEPPEGTKCRAILDIVRERWARGQTTTYRDIRHIRATGI